MWGLLWHTVAGVSGWGSQPPRRAPFLVHTGWSGTFCSRKRPSMMLLHRSSVRLRSTTWSRTSSLGFAAGAEGSVSRCPEGLPPPPGPLPYPGSVAVSPGPPTRSRPRGACAPSGPRAAAAAPEASRRGVLPWVARLGQGRPGGCICLPGPPHLPPGLADVHTQEHPVLARSQLQRLPGPSAGSTVGAGSQLSCGVRVGASPPASTQHPARAFLTIQPRPLLALGGLLQRAPLTQGPRPVSPGPPPQPASGPVPGPLGSVSIWVAGRHAGMSPMLPESSPCQGFNYPQFVTRLCPSQVCRQGQCLPALGTMGTRWSPGESSRTPSAALPTYTPSLGPQQNCPL